MIFSRPFGNVCEVLSKSEHFLNFWHKWVKTIDMVQWQLANNFYYSSIIGMDFKESCLERAIRYTGDRQAQPSSQAAAPSTKHLLKA